MNRKKPQQPIEEATPERLAKAEDGERTRFKTESGRTITRLSLLDGLFGANKISGQAYTAGELYRHDWYVGMYQSCTIDLAQDRVDGGASRDAFNASKMDASKRYANAGAAVGQIYRDALWIILIEDEGYSGYARRYLRSTKPYARKKAQAIFIEALNALAKHYDKSASRPRTQTRSYMQDGTRATIHPYHQDDAA